jgi:hypothetical protein
VFPWWARAFPPYVKERRSPKGSWRKGDEKELGGRCWVLSLACLVGLLAGTCSDATVPASVTLSIGVIGVGPTEGQVPLVDAIQAPGSSRFHVDR